MPRKAKSVADQLRQAILKAEKRGLTRYQIAQETGLSEGTLSTFMNLGTDIRISTAEKIARTIGCKIDLTSCP